MVLGSGFRGFRVGSVGEMGVSEKRVVHGPNKLPKSAILGAWFRYLIP